MFKLLSGITTHIMSKHPDIASNDLSEAFRHYLKSRTPRPKGERERSTNNS